MPKIGDIHIDPPDRPSISIRANCGHNDRDDSHGSFQAPRGWIIYDVRMHEITDNGRKTNKYPNGGALLRSPQYESFMNALRKVVGAFLPEIMIRPEFKDTFEKIQLALDRGWFDLFSAMVSCYTDLSHTAEIARDYYISTIYIGETEETLPDEIAQWLSGYTIVQKYVWSDYKDFVVSRARFGVYMRDKELLFSHEPPNGEDKDGSSVFINRGPFPEGTEIHFKARLQSEGPDRKIHLQIWGFPSSANPTVVARSQDYTLTNQPYQEFEVNSVLEDSFETRSEIYWEDTFLENVIVKLDETLVTFTKTF